MAILFFEGLPRAGKSYEAMVTQIIPFLQKGKEVVAYIEGLNHDRIAEAAGIPVERVKELLFPLTRDDMKPREIEVNGKKVAIDGTWIEKTRDNALHVLDEAQNWWPNRLKATDQLTQFVTEHGHRGITVLLMGQSLKDVLALWRRRVDQKLVFLKLTHLGQAKRYRVTIYKGLGDDTFVKVTDKFGSYDPKYFGTYASHVSDSTETETYTDARVNFWSSGFVKYAVPFIIVALVWGGWKSWSFFHPEPVAAKPGSISAARATGAASPGAAPSPASAPAAPPKPVDTRSPEERYFADLSDKARVRFGGLVTGTGRRYGVVEWVDGGTRVIERLTFAQLEALGVAILVRADTAKLTLGDWKQIATMWPGVEPEGRMSDAKLDAMRPAREMAGPGPQTIAAGPSGLIYMDTPRPAPQAPATPAVATAEPQRIGSYRR